jgi:hypothetical protein
MNRAGDSPDPAPHSLRHAPVPGVDSQRPYSFLILWVLPDGARFIAAGLPSAAILAEVTAHCQFRGGFDFFRAATDALDQRRDSSQRPGEVAARPNNKRQVSRRLQGVGRGGMAA